MKNFKFTVMFLFLVSLVLSPLTAVLAEDDPLPPTELLDWLDYALKRFPPEDCPTIGFSEKICAAVTHVDLKGDLKSGRITAEFTGYNWSRRDQTVDLIGPSSAVNLENFALSLSELLDPSQDQTDYIAPYFSATSGSWKIDVPPGKFKLSTDLVFETKSVLPLRIADGVGKVDVAGITGGFVQFDDVSGNHGGEIQLMFDGEKKDAEEKPQIRVTRIFQWGSIPTFTYIVQVSGLRNEFPVAIALLSDEVIELSQPDKPYTIESQGNVRYFQTTFSPTLREIRIKGHFKKTPETFALGEDLPFEIWVHLSDKRFPVQIDTDAKPVDPEEFAGEVDVSHARSFMVRPNQKLSFHPIALNVDEGRKGKGSIEYNLFEGADGYWLEKMFLKAKIAGQDRLVIPTPTSPTYAGIGSDGVELFHDDKNLLSVRLPRSGIGSDEVIEVNWNNTRDPVRLFSMFTSVLPAQNVYLDQQEVSVNFAPGVVPILALGGNTTSGDLIDQFHLYGFLIGILAFFLSRGLKFGWMLSLLVSLLFVGLYLEHAFPTTSVIVLFFVTLPFVHLGEGLMSKLRESTFKRRLVLLCWLIFFLNALVPLVQYGSERVYQALHPHAEAVSEVYLSNMPQSISANSYGYGRNQKPKLKKYEGDDYDITAIAPSPNEAYDTGQEQMAVQKVMSGSSMGGALTNRPSVPSKVQNVYQAGEWKAKPVSMDAHSRGKQVKFISYNVAEGVVSEYRVVLAGSLLRGLWMLFETGLISWMVVALASRSRRLWAV